jgi:hypothetical protein
MKTSNLSGVALDWAVAKCERLTAPSLLTVAGQRFARKHKYSTDWAQGGPIIERERISVTQFGGAWKASTVYQFAITGPTPLIAAMRCYVASKIGEDIDIPSELIGE